MLRDHLDVTTYERKKLNNFRFLMKVLESKQILFLNRSTSESFQMQQFFCEQLLFEKNFFNLGPNPFSQIKLGYRSSQTSHDKLLIVFANRKHRLIS